MAEPSSGSRPIAKTCFRPGHVCAKGLALRELEDDPDRIRMPLVKDGAGFREASWNEAFAVINERLNGVIDQHGAGAVATLQWQSHCAQHWPSHWDRAPFPVCSERPPERLLGRHRRSNSQHLASELIVWQSHGSARPRHRAIELYPDAGGQTPSCRTAVCGWCLTLGASFEHSRDRGGGLLPLIPGARKPLGWRMNMYSSGREADALAFDGADQ